MRERGGGRDEQREGGREKEREREIEKQRDRDRDRQRQRHRKADLNLDRNRMKRQMESHPKHSFSSCLLGYCPGNKEPGGRTESPGTAVPLLEAVRVLRALMKKVPSPHISK